MKRALGCAVILLVVGFTSGIARAQEATPAPDDKKAQESESILKRADPTIDSDTIKYSVLLSRQERRFTFGLYSGISQFTRAGTQLLGYTLEVAANYALYEKIAASMSISQAVSAEGGISVLFTGIQLAAAYAFWGDFVPKSDTVMVNGTPTYIQSSGQDSVILGEVGLDQYLFNGNDRIVPGTGISFGGRYDFNFWALRTSVFLRYGALIIANDAVQMMTTGVGILLRF